MSSTVAFKLVTADELWQMPDSNFLELVEGRIREMAPAGMEHSEYAAELAALIRNHVKANGLGTVIGEAGGFLLRHDPDTVRAADVAFISKARAEKGRTAKFFDGAPDLAVEVISPGDKWVEITQKAGEWISAGARSVWVVDPRGKAFYRFEDGKLVPFGDDVTDDVLPGFKLEVASFFRRD